MLDQAAIAFADRQRRRHRRLLGAHQLGEFLGDRALDHRMGEAVDASEDRFGRAQLAGGVGGGADAVPVYLEDDLLHQVQRQQRDQRPGAPAMLVERQLDDVGLLLLQIFEQRRLVLAPIVDTDRHLAAMAARIGDDVPGGEDARRQDLARPLVRAQPHDMGRDVAGVVHGGDARIDVARQRLDARGAGCPGVRRNLRRGGRTAVAIDADHSPPVAAARALQVDMDVHQARHQILAAGVDAAPGDCRGGPCRRDESDAALIHPDRHVQLLRLAGAVDQSHIVDHIILGQRRRGEGESEGAGAAEEAAADGFAGHGLPFTSAPWRLIRLPASRRSAERHGLV